MTDRRTFLKGLLGAAAAAALPNAILPDAAFATDRARLRSTMGMFTAGSGSPNPRDHSWWYAPLDLAGRAPKAADSDRRLHNLNAWLGRYSAESKKFVGRFLYFPNGMNVIPIYHGDASDRVLDWGGVKMHTPRDCPRPGSTAKGTREGHLILIDPTYVMATGDNGRAASVFRRSTKGIQHGIFDGTSGNDGPRGRNPWAKSLLRHEFDKTGGFRHRIGIGWPDGDQIHRHRYGKGAGAFRTKQHAWPLTGNDGAAIYAIEGQVLRIKPDVDINAFRWRDPVAHALARTMQKFGAVIMDGAGPFAGGPLMNGYRGKSLELVSHIPITPRHWEFVRPGYDPRSGTVRHG